MNIREVTADDMQAWVGLRHALWPHHPPEELRPEADRILVSPNEVCLLAFSPKDHPIGFIEGAIYQGCRDPYAHVEGWYVAPEQRHQGLGRKLVGELEQWCLHRSIRVLTSDTDPGFPLSPGAHARSGFRRLAEMTLFIKELKVSGSDTP